MAYFTKDELDEFTALSRQVPMAQLDQPKTPVKQRGRGGFISSLISEGGALGGALKGAALGSAAGPLGTLLGGIGGGFAGGTLGRLAENKIRDDEFRPTEALKEGAISGVAMGPIKGLKAASGAIKGAATRTGVREGAEKALTSPSFMSKMVGQRGSQFKQRLEDRATTNLLGLTAAQNKKLLDQGIDPTRLAKLANRYGKSAEEIIGRTGSKGPLQDTIKSLEAGIAKTASTTGKNVRIGGDEILSQLKSQRKIIAKELGGANRVKQLDKIIADVEKKYAKGVTVKQARDILREANQRFGASVLDDSGDAVARAAQKLEGNLMRKALKDRFPSISKALDDESDLIQLREILKGKRAKDITGKFKVGGLDVTRPGTFLDPLLNSGVVSRKVLGEGSEVVSKPNRLNFASRILATHPLDTAPPSDAESEVASALALEPTEQDIAQAELEASQQTSNSPFASENIESNIEKILAQGGTLDDVKDYLAIAATIGELKGSQQKPLSAEASKVLANANSGLTSLDQLESMIAKGGVPKGTIAPGRGLLGGLGSRALGTSAYDAANNNIADVITRLRTGAAITESEERFYKSMLPQAFDDENTVAQKLNMFRDLFSSISNRTGSAGSELESTLGAYQ